MTMKYDDFTLYYNQTWMLVDDVLTYISGVSRAESQTNYSIMTHVVAETGVLSPAKEVSSRHFLSHAKPFIPQYGYVNYDGFAVLSTLGAYRMARKAFSLDRIDFFVPNQAELAKYLKLKQYSRDGWLKEPSLVAWLHRATYETWEQALDILSNGGAAGVALSPDFAVCSFLKQDTLHLFYKDLEMGVVDKEGGVVLTERGKIFNSFFRSEVKFTTEGIAA